MENMLYLFCTFHLPLLLQETMEISTGALAERTLLQAVHTTVTSHNEQNK